DAAIDPLSPSLVRFAAAPLTCSKVRLKKSSSTCLRPSSRSSSAIRNSAALGCGDVETDFDLLPGGLPGPRSSADLPPACNCSRHRRFVVEDLWSDGTGKICGHGKICGQEDLWSKICGQGTGTLLEVGQIRGRSPRSQSIGKTRRQQIEFVATSGAWAKWPINRYPEIFLPIGPRPNPRAGPVYELPTIRPGSPQW
ncbi:MAG: hypothetical protein QOE55_3325, partial [Acidobacteriaceae bacterium]|nr:hypothetical protein [Acidobacteriaceae bacterium]